MSLHKKLQETFNWLIDAFREDDTNTDLYKFSPVLEKKLKEQGIQYSSAQFIDKIFDALEYPSPAWHPNPDDLLVFFDSLPNRMIVERWDFLNSYIPKSQWGKYNKQWAKTTSSFVNTLSDEPVILIEEDKNKNLIFSVYLGDITNKLGLTSKDLKYNYDTVYDAIDNEVGYAAIQKYLPEGIQIIDWPNASVITNAKYEFLVKPEKDPAIVDIQNTIVLALNKIGF